MCVYLPICQPSICCRSIFFLSIYLMAACVLLSVLKCSWLLVGVIRCFWQVFGCGRVWKGSEKVSPPPPQKNQNNGWPPGVTCETQICKSAGKIKWNLLQGARTNQKNNKQDPNKNIQNFVYGNICCCALSTETKFSAGISFGEASRIIVVCAALRKGFRNISRAVNLGSRARDG